MKYGLQFALVIAWAALPLPLCGQQKQESPAPHTGGSSILQEYDQSLDQIAERAMRSVVQIDVTSYSVPEHGQGDDAQNFQRQRALGSGVIVDPDGYIVTNNHVVAGALRIRVTRSPATVELVTGRTVLSRKERVYEAKLIGTNRYADLAVIKIEEKTCRSSPFRRTTRCG